MRRRPTRAPSTSPTSTPCATSGAAAGGRQGLRGCDPALGPHFLFFSLCRPLTARTAIYHELLAAYISDARARGFERAFIWACPPMRGDGYIFHAHPAMQVRRRRRWLPGRGNEGRLKGGRGIGGVCQRFGE